jgi:Leucine-rich repeat (LRR) protein
MSHKHSNLGFAEFLLSSEEDATVGGRSAAWIAQFDDELDQWISEGGTRPQEQRAAAAGKIAACRDHNLTRLDLSRMGLTSLPDCIGQLQQLEWLVLVSNQLTHLPEWVFKLRDLCGLYLSCNKIAEIPETLINLSRLQSLRLDHNQLEKLPAALTQLRTLRQLSFGHNRIESMPEEIWLLPDLDADTLCTLERMGQENRIAFLEHRARGLSNLITEATTVADEIRSAAGEDDWKAKDFNSTRPHQGLIGLLNLQKVRIDSQESALRQEIDSLRIEIAVRNAEQG